MSALGTLSAQTPAPQTYDAIVLGAGAAGLLCAIEAGRRNLRVLLLDHADKAGKKILISGGGRCNFTNLDCRPENFLSENAHFAKSALSRYTPADFLELVQQHNIPFHEKTLGQLFCDRSAHDIVTMLEREAAQASVRTILGATVIAVTHNSNFRVETSVGTFHAAAVVVATGGLSIPKMGATGLGYQIAQYFGHRIVPTRPALVPLTFTPRDMDRWADLAGLSTEVVTTTAHLTPENCHPSRNGGPGESEGAASALPTPAKKSKSRAPAPTFREKLLITHRGLSGPAILQISSYWQPGQPIQFDLAPGANVMEPMLATLATVQSSARAQVFAPVRTLPRRDLDSAYDLLRVILPARMAERWLTLHPPPDWTNPGIAAFEQHLHTWTITPTGTEGYAKAEVTAGGVDTAELDARTLESKRRPGLYFIGEVVDVTGWLGGYNFQWAWASGAAAGRSL